MPTEHIHRVRPGDERLLRELRLRALGRLLLAEVESWARGGGGRSLRLGVIEGRGVEGFYLRLGFEPTGEVMRLRRDQSLTAVFFARPVASSSSS